MAGINYETELNESLNSLNKPIDINKGRVTSYHGIGAFMGKLCTSLTAVEEEVANIKASFNEYNNAINDVPFPLSPQEVEQSLSGEMKYKLNKGEEII